MSENKEYYHYVNIISIHIYYNSNCINILYEYLVFKNKIAKDNKIIRKLSSFKSNEVVFALNQNHNKNQHNVQKVVLERYRISAQTEVNNFYSLLFRGD